MSGGNLVFAYGAGRGRPLAFPTQNGQPILISREQWEECCCDGGPCAVCAAATLREWTLSHGFPTKDTGVLPYALDGLSLDGTTSLGGIGIEESAIKQIGPSAFSDAAVLIFPVVRKNFTISYDYRITGGGKHWVNVMSSQELASQTLLIGSWSTNSADTRGRLLAGPTNTGSACIEEYPPPELDGILPQEQNVWRTRSITKRGKTLLFTDGSVGPITLSRCYFPVRGHISLTLGPWTYVRNIRIDPA